MKCPKFLCLGCRRYFNTRIAGVRLGSRSTENLKRAVFAACNSGCPASTVARDYGIGTASVERFCHHVLDLENRPIFPVCPRIPGIDGHRFTQRHGFAAPFCDLRHRRVFDIALGRDRVRIVCMDMNRAYRRLVNERIRLFLTERDDENLSCNRGHLMRLMTMARDRLDPARQKRLDRYFQDQPAIGILYGFWHDLNDLLRSENQTMAGCKRLIPGFPGYLQQRIPSPFEPLKRPGRTLSSWKEEIVRMFRFSHSSGITGGFHWKMKLIQRRAYGFRNFENGWLRVRALCG